MLERETEATGITSLKIASNNVFGYYIEVRNTHKDKVPGGLGFENRPWSTPNAISPKNSKNTKVKYWVLRNASIALEQQLFEQLLVWMQEYIAPVQQNAQLIAQLDCLCGFALLAKTNNYVLAQMDDSTVLEIRGRTASGH